MRYKEMLKDHPTTLLATKVTGHKYCLPEERSPVPSVLMAPDIYQILKRLQTWTTLIPHGNYSLALKFLPRCVSGENKVPADRMRSLLGSDCAHSLIFLLLVFRLS